MKVALGKGFGAATLMGSPNRVEPSQSTNNLAATADRDYSAPGS